MLAIYFSNVVVCKDMGDPGTEGQGLAGGKLLDRVHYPQKKKDTPEQRLVYEAAREVLKPFEEHYHQQATDLKKRPLKPGVRSDWLRNEYTMEIETASGTPVNTKVRTGSLGGRSIIRELQIGLNKVIFDKDGRIQEIVLVNEPALPRVTELRESLLGPHAVNGIWRNSQVRLSVRSATEMQLEAVNPGKDNRFEPIFVVKKDGTLKEKEKEGYTTTTLRNTRVVKNPHFPDILKSAMEAINPLNN